VILDGHCAGPLVCPLSRVKAGVVVRIKELPTPPEVRSRLREMGLGEKQKVKLLSRDSSIICQVCNARLGISRRLAESIFVEVLPAQMAAA
jgi:Fe2+ transport system protein FeoA